MVLPSAVDDGQLFVTQDPITVFDLQEELAVGSFGTVYRALFKPQNKTVALKICQVDPQDEDAYNDLVTEIKVLIFMEFCSE